MSDDGNDPSNRRLGGLFLMLAIVLASALLLVGVYGYLSE